MTSEHLLDVSSWILPLIIAVTLHEAAHGFVANWLGDSTAKRLGRVTLDPLKHIDPMGTLVLPSMLMLVSSPFLFGYAKPVPVNFGNLRRPRLDSILVALAGPGMNVLLALISALLIHLEWFVSPEQAPWMFMNIYKSVNVNIVLAVFNLLPILPLDGGRVLNNLLPPKLAHAHAKTERFGLIIVLVLFILPINLFTYLVGIPADFLRDGILYLVGIGAG